MQGRAVSTVSTVSIAQYSAVWGRAGQGRAVSTVRAVRGISIGQ